MRYGGDQIIPVKDAQSKARVADVETKAVSGSRIRDIEATYSEPTAARRIRNEEIGGIALLVCIVVAIFLLFFVIL